MKDGRVEKIVGYLKNAEIFSKISENVLSYLAEVTLTIDLPANTSFIKMGEEGDSMYILVSGTVKVHEGENVIATVGPGEILGELTLIDPKPRSLSVTTLEEVELYEIKRKDFLDIIEKYPELIRPVVTILVQRLRNVDKALLETYKAREKKLKDLVTERTKDLEEKNIELEKATKVKEQFLANMSHEIRTPLNAISGMINLLLKGEISNDQYKYLNTIRKSSDNLLVIINDILDFSKIEAGRIELEEIPFELKEQVETVYQTLKLKADEKEIGFEYDLDDELPHVLIGDPVRLNQILINLTGNAIKFTDKGSVHISISEIKNKNKLTGIRFKISDTGIGIADDKLDSIFETFTQASTDTTRRHGGTGLGLSISKQLVGLQEGKIWAESILGKGSDFIFEIYFPVGREDAIKGEIDEIDLALIKSDLRGLKILLVEDNPFNVMVAEDTIKSEISEAEVEVASNGVEAVDKYDPKKFDIVLMDLHMPEMDGLTATKKINEMNGGIEIPILAMTANVLPNELSKCYDVGMVDVIPKPFEIDELLIKMYNAINTKD